MGEDVVRTKPNAASIRPDATGLERMPVGWHWSGPTLGFGRRRRESSAKDVRFPIGVRAACVTWPLPCIPWTQHDTIRHNLSAPGDLGQAAARRVAASPCPMFERWSIVVHLSRVTTARYDAVTPGDRDVDANHRLHRAGRHGPRRRRVGIAGTGRDRHTGDGDPDGRGADSERHARPSPSLGAIVGDGEAWIAAQGDGTIRLIRPDGSGDHVPFPLVPGGEQLHPDWSPDGKRLSFTTRGETDEIWIGNADGPGPARSSSARRRAHWADEAAWSPDGTSLIFQRMAAKDGAGVSTLETPRRGDRHDPGRRDRPGGSRLLPAALVAGRHAGRHRVRRVDRPAARRQRHGRRPGDRGPLGRRTDDHRDHRCRRPHEQPGLELGHRPDRLRPAEHSGRLRRPERPRHDEARRLRPDDGALGRPARRPDAAARLVDRWVADHLRPAGQFDGDDRCGRLGPGSGRRDRARPRAAPALSAGDEPRSRPADPRLGWGRGRRRRLDHGPGAGLRHPGDEPGRHRQRSPWTRTSISFCPNLSPDGSEVAYSVRFGGLFFEPLGERTGRRHIGRFSQFGFMDGVWSPDRSHLPSGPSSKGRSNASRSSR